jgi:hypothetical protein
VSLDDAPGVAYLLNDARQALRQAHSRASEDGGLTGPVRDALFGINTLLDSLMSILELEQTP